MKVLHVAAECAPIVKVGGLADVVGSLPIALSKLGVDASVALPYYKGIQISKERLIHCYTVTLLGKQKTNNNSTIQQFDNEVIEVYQTQLADSKVPVYLFKNEKYLSDGPYSLVDATGGTSEQKLARAKEEARFSFFNLAVAEFLKKKSSLQEDFLELYDVVHCHDYHAALLCRDLKSQKSNIKSILTIHNLANKGTKKIGLKMGIETADFVTTVSPQYAKEILTPEFGKSLAVILQQRNQEGKLKGVLNGIDTSYWDPLRDDLIDRRYRGDPGDQGDFKQANKEFLIKQLELDYTFGDKVPVFGFVGRLSKQKGLDILVPAWRKFSKKHHAHLVILGAGNPKLASEILDQEVEASELAGRPEVAFIDKFDEKLAHQIYAGADFLLMPSKFEPCGLSQMIAMRYGTVPIVRDVGGLHDSVRDGQTGLVFKEYTVKSLTEVLMKASRIFNSQFEIFNKIREAGMAGDFSWDKSAKEYLEIYDKICQD